MSAAAAFQQNLAEFLSGAEEMHLFLDRAASCFDGRGNRKQDEGGVQALLGRGTRLPPRFGITQRRKRRGSRKRCLANNKNAYSFLLLLGRYFLW